MELHSHRCSFYKEAKVKFTKQHKPPPLLPAMYALLACTRHCAEHLRSATNVQPGHNPHPMLYQVAQHLDFKVSRYHQNYHCQRRLQRLLESRANQLPDVPDEVQLRPKDDFRAIRHQAVIGKGWAPASRKELQTLATADSSATQDSQFLCLESEINIVDDTCATL